jgi:hypothetical protein
MINTDNVSFKGVYPIKGDARQVEATTKRIQQQCKLKQIDCDVLEDSNSARVKTVYICTENDAAACRTNKAEYKSFTKAMKELSDKYDDDINTIMKEAPKMSKSLLGFIEKINDVLMNIILQNNTAPINKDLDEGKFDLVNGMGPNLSDAISQKSDEIINEMLEGLRKK